MKTEVGLSKPKTEFERIKGHPAARPSMKETTLCPICRYAVQDTWRFCPHCGIKLKPIVKEVHEEN